MKTSLLPMLLLAVALAVAPFVATPVSAQSAGTIILQIDRPGANEQLVNTGWFGGWAIDQSLVTAPGIGQIAVFMDGDATNGKFLGMAQLGGSRPDVAAQFGNPAYTYSGWNFSLDNLGLTGQHSFTFVAFGVQGVVSAKSVDTVTLLAPPPPYGYGQPPASPYYGYGYGYGQPPAPGYGYGYNYNTAPPYPYQYQYTAPVVYPYTAPQTTYYTQPWYYPTGQPTTTIYTQPTTSTPIYTQPVTTQPTPTTTTSTQPTPLNPSGTNLWSGTGSTPNVPQVNLPQYGAPTSPNYSYTAPWGYPPPRVTAPVSLSITSPASSWWVGTSFQLTGVTGAVPYSGSITYTLTNQKGTTIASGTLSVSGSAGQGGSFSGAVSYGAGNYGIGTLTVVETDGGTTVGSTTISLGLLY